MFQQNEFENKCLKQSPHPNHKKYIFFFTYPLWYADSYRCILTYLLLKLYYNLSEF